MRKLQIIFLMAATLGFASNSALAAGGDVHLDKQDWAFDGPFGTYDQASLQRGYQVYREVCSACHSMRLVSFRHLTDLGYNDAQIKAFAAEYDIVDGPDDEGEMFERPRRPSDPFPSPYANDNAARATNNGALPPDMSLLAKARAHGPDYIYTLLTSYEEEVPHEINEHLAEDQKIVLGEGQYFNHTYSGYKISMAPPLSDELVTYADGTKPTVHNMSYDVSQFLMWAAEPKLNERKSLGMKVILFLLALTALLYAMKRRIWSRIH